MTLIRIHNPNILVLLEMRVNNLISNFITSRSNLSNSIISKAKGYVRGNMDFFWNKSKVDLESIIVEDHIVNVVGVPIEDNPMVILYYL